MKLGNKPMTVAWNETVGDAGPTATMTIVEGCALLDAWLVQR